MTIFLFIFLSIFSLKSLSLNTINSGEFLIDDGQTLISSGENFELGFFTPWNSNNRYVGIWFKKVSTLTPYWVANNQNPLPNFNFTGVLTLTPTGDVLVIDNMTSSVYWSSNSSSETVRNPRLMLLDSGNLVVADGNTGEYTWQSFDHPGDTMVSGMKLGFDSIRRRDTWLTSWRSLTDASPGEYTYRLDTHGLPEMILRRGNQIQMRSGPWDGYNFGGFPTRRSNAIVSPFFTYNSSGIYYGFADVTSTITRFVVNQTGLVEHQQWNPTRSQWLTMASVQRDNCDNFNHCGPNAICNINNEPECRCADGFIPKTLQGWQRFDWSDGCVPIIPNDCSRKMGFRVFGRLKLPANSIFLANSSSIQCEETCLMNCSCVGYAKIDLTGCVIWFGDFIDIKEYAEDGQTLYLKLDASELVAGSRSRRKRTPIIALVVSVISAVILLGLIGFLIRKRTAQKSKVLTDEGKNMLSQELKSTEQDDLELPLFDYATVLTATNDLSHTNKIGEGGFGAVFKGVLPNGQEIAVKKLSKDSGQGTNEFKNEVILYLKLQHRNLVRLFGCCIHGEEKMLVYEYLPNRSLDLIIFNQTRGTSLDWAKRYEIIVGIARGLLYLHRDSRLRIIHRDLKASNILLDKSMHPKISDFGLAKAFGADQNEEITKRIVGTYGYMSPEYAIDGYYSIKSDVFSFGVLVLEIISGKKNRGFFDPDHSLNLLGHAWKLWIEGTPIDLVDELLEGPINTSEALRCIHMGLLCVQQKPEHRPTMSSVLWMLDSENPVLPQPKQPGFYTERFLKNNSTSGGKSPVLSSNEVTSTVIYEGR